MTNFTHLEIAIEVAWQIGDVLSNSPRAESRWHIAELAKEIIESGIITPETDDIDEVIRAWIDNEIKEYV